MKKVWTLEEKQFLIDNHDNYTIKELAEKFNVTTARMSNKLNKLGLKRDRKKLLNDEQITFLKDNHDKFNKDELCEILGINFNQLRFQLKKMGLKYKKKVELWSEEEKDILRKYSHLRVCEVAKLLNRSEIAITTAYKVFKIKRNYRQEWSKEAIGILKEKPRNMNELSELFPNKNHNQILHCCKKYNIKVLESYQSIIDGVLNVKCFKCELYKPYNSKYFRLKSVSNIYTCKLCKSKMQLKRHWKLHYGITLDLHKGVDTYDVIEWYEFRKKCKFRSYPVELFKHKSNVAELGKHIILNEFKAKTKHEILSISVDDFRFYMTDKILHKFYDNYKDFILKEFSDFNITHNDLNMYFLRDGITPCDSMAERSVFHHLEDMYDADIEIVGRKRSKFYHNIKYNESYNPDFVVSSIGGFLLDKPLIVEYFGLYTDSPSSETLMTYKEKTIRKCEFFNNKEDIYFIDIYPYDLKNNYQGLNNKIHKFINNYKVKEVIRYKEE